MHYNNLNRATVSQHFRQIILLFLTTFWVKIGPYDIFYIVVYVTLTNLWEHGIAFIQCLLQFYCILFVYGL